MRNGKWHAPYTDRTFTDPSKLDVGHVVPLKEASLSRACNWNSEKKRKYANELGNKDHLILTHNEENSRKGSRDLAGWMPPNKTYHREYLRIWREEGQAFDLLIRNESGYFAPFSFNQRPDPFSFGVKPDLGKSFLVDEILRQVLLYQPLELTLFCRFGTCNGADVIQRILKSVAFVYLQ